MRRGVSLPGTVGSKSYGYVAPVYWLMQKLDKAWPRIYLTLLFSINAHRAAHILFVNVRGAARVIL